MLRAVAGILCLLAPFVLELRGQIPEAWEGAFRPVVWITLVGLGLLLLLSGVVALRRELAQDRAYAQTPRSRFELSPASRAVIGVMTLLTLVSLALRSQGEVELERADWPPREEILLLPHENALKLMALGYREFVADLVWLRAIAYFGEHLQTDRKYRWLDRYLETIIHLDPRFKGVYRYAGAITMYNLRVITREAVQASLHYLEKGYRQFPKDWEFPFMICSNYLFEMPRFARDAAEKQRFQEIGAEYCREASVLPGALHYLPSMAGGVLSRLGKRQLAERHFRELILRTEDPKLREQLKLRYAALVSEQEAKRLERDAAAFFESHRLSYPYLSPDLFFLLGPRGVTPDAIPVIRAACGLQRAK
jgi:hypothetical protein